MSGFGIEHERFRLDELPSAQALELIAFQMPLTTSFSGDWPTRPGGVHRDSSGRPIILHCAPNRWLIPAADSAVTALVGDAVASQACARIDVTGKWRAFRMSGPAARRLLASTMDVEAALEGFDCASLVLFDCPAVLARSNDAYLVWVQRSYCAGFVSAIRNQLAALPAGHDVAHAGQPREPHAMDST
jgi:heterotetrameric sarcosine oxidase gamma subunit